MKLYGVKQIIISLVLILPMLFLFIGCNDEVVKDKSKSSTESSTTTSTTVTTTQVTISEVESTYNKVRNMTIYNLTEKTSSMTGTKFYYYGSLPIQTEDAEFLTASYNTTKALNQGAIYRSVSKALQGFQMGINTGDDYARLLTGKPYTSKDDFKPYVDNAVTFICDDEPLIKIFSKIQTIPGINGAFDYDNRHFQVTIPNLKEACDFMMISEEMLGYIFGELEEYGATFTFNGNSCQIVCHNAFAVS